MMGNLSIIYVLQRDHRKTYHSMAENDLVARTLREKFLNDDIRKMIGN